MKQTIHIPKGHKAVVTFSNNSVDIQVIKVKYNFLERVEKRIKRNKDEK